MGCGRIYSDVTGPGCRSPRASAPPELVQHASGSRYDFTRSKLRGHRLPNRGGRPPRRRLLRPAPAGARGGHGPRQRARRRGGGAAAAARAVHARASGDPGRAAPTPDAADQRHQLYVQWLNARASDPDILQLDAIWTPEFAAAGWILAARPLSPPTPPRSSPPPSTANRWQGRLYAMPWFVDVGMLYWRTDLRETPPATFDELDRTRCRGAAPRSAVATAWCIRAPATRGW